jgi:hypothetical protein
MPYKNIIKKYTIGAFVFSMLYFIANAMILDNNNKTTAQNDKAKFLYFGYYPAWKNSEFPPSTIPSSYFD